jgi:signal transduction histidine kinase
MKTESVTADLFHSIKWYVYVHLFFLFALAIPGIAAQYFTEGWVPSVQRDLILLAVGIGVNFIFYFLANLRLSVFYLQVLVRVMIALDILLITALLFIKGGIESRSPILYTLPILVSSAIFGRRSSYVTALACSVAYIGLIVADYNNLIHSVGAFDPTLRQNLEYVIQSVCFFPSILFVIALAADFITKLLHDKQTQATQHLDNLVTAQEIAKLGSWEWDMQKDKVTWSAELFKLFGVNPERQDLTYDTYLQLIHPDDTKAMNHIITTAFKNNTSFKADHRILLADGTIKYIHSEGRPILDDHGKVFRMAGTAQDVTEMRTLDIAKRDFISLASHQLRTPASGVKAFLSILLDGHAGELTKRQREFIIKANESNDRQLDIINSLLNLAAIQSGKIHLKKEIVDLRSILNHSLADHRADLKAKHQKLTVQKSRQPLYLSADPTHLRMVIDNILSNAIKYTPEKGRITIATWTSSTSAYLEVTDTGIGIAKTDLPALFQKFSRLHNPASKTVEGSGLGLYLAKSIITLHGGTITVRSKLGNGTRFRIKLPLLKRKK